MSGPKPTDARPPVAHRIFLHVLTGPYQQPILLVPAERLGGPELCECHVSADRAACDGLHHPGREERERQLDAQVALGKTLPLCDGGQVSLAPAGQSLGAGPCPSDRPQQDLASMSRDGLPAWRACNLPDCPS